MTRTRSGGISGWRLGLSSPWSSWEPLRDAFVIPSGAAQRRRRGIAIVLVEGPLGREDGDSSTPFGRSE